MREKATDGLTALSRLNCPQPRMSEMIVDFTDGEKPSCATDDSMAMRRAALRSVLLHHLQTSTVVIILDLYRLVCARVR